ncbi:hypothetical protein B0J13DRAFT_608907 [Dactylonectria estremocensis]|uniref:Uncharacterized protein n=1 Tax=Dactylonectria estremocensis TaxID=1079267 RepID=A0A9P9EL44_9HYPO|nr:hypothetical protein B0J13DRAFT_608907 [Dactylonectria estremocensis]
MLRKSSGWLSEAIRWQSLLLFVTFDIAFLITIIVLTVISSTENGFATINSSNITSNGSIVLPGGKSSIFNVSWDLGVLWTTLPNFIFTLFGAYWAWIAGAISDRQPYVELRKRGGCEARTSILLDYRVLPVVWRWWVAFRKSHGTVGATTLLSVLLTYVVAPFAARLFAAHVVMVSETLPVAYNVTFDGNNINAEIDWRPIMDTVAATLLYQGNNIPWTDDQHAFRPFATDSRLTTGADMVANTTAYAAYVNCELSQDYTIVLDPQDSGSGTVTVTGTDRGCEFKQDFGVSSLQKIYFKTTSQIDCSSRAYYSRLVFTAATYSSSAPSLLDDISVISCATGYQQATGNLKVLALTGSPIIQSFDQTAQLDTTRPSFWRGFEQNILGPVSFNPQAEWSTTDMGSLILYNAQRLQPSNPLTADILIKSISDVFTAVYLNAVAIHGFDQLSAAETGIGRAFIPTTRLFIVPWVAYIIIVFLSITVYFVGSVFFYVRKSPSILTEEPEGLLSMAAILNGSELLDIASDIRGEPGFNGEVCKIGKALPEVKGRRWTATRDPVHGQWVIGSI